MGNSINALEVLQSMKLNTPGGCRWSWDLVCRQPTGHTPEWVRKSVLSLQESEEAVQVLLAEFLMSKKTSNGIALPVRKTLAPSQYLL